MQVAPLDCLGCGVCEDVCPTKTKSLVMQPIASQYDQIENWEYAAEKSKESLGIPADNVKNSQFRTPYLEFSGACAGSGETPYAKVITQLYGDSHDDRQCYRMFLYLGRVLSFLSLYYGQQGKRSCMGQFPV